MKKVIFLLSLISIVLVQSCSDLKVTSDYDKSADFTTFKTFNIMRYQEGVLESTPLPLMTISFIEEAIIDELMARGYTLSDDPDIEVYYFVRLNAKTELVQTGVSGGMYYGSPYYYGYHGGYTYYNDVREVDYTEGSLIVELVDNKKDRAIWQGVAVKSVAQSQSSQKNIRMIISKVFYNYKWKVESTEGIQKQNERYQKPDETY